MEQAIDELPDPFRATFMLRFIEHMSIEQRAACFGIPADTVKTRIHRAERRLHQAPGEQRASTLVGTFPLPARGALASPLRQCVDVASRGEGPPP
jgi:RNA polymerase sigma-70 factor, ECF subfamily